MYQNVCHVLKQKTLLLSYISHNLQHILLGRRAFMATIQNNKKMRHLHGTQGDSMLKLKYYTLHIVKRNWERGTIWSFLPYHKFPDKF